MLKKKHDVVIHLSANGSATFAVAMIGQISKAVSKPVADPP